MNPNHSVPENPLFYCVPSRVVLAVGARHQVAPLCRAQGWRQALIVTDRFFTQRTTVVSELIAALQAQGIQALVYDGGLPDPSTILCAEATAEVLAQAGADQIDHLIAVGGGSNIDLAKALCLTLRYRQPVETFVGSSSQWPGKPMPLVALPTTAGTGSEITPGAILVQPSSATKVAVMGNDLRPHIAVIDPELTLSCPAKVTADAGLDALTHAIESWLTLDARDFDLAGDPDPGYSGRNRVTNLFARESVTLCWQHLLAAYTHPQDLGARTGMAYASLLAAMSYGSAGLNAVHGLAYALAGLTHASHGSTNAVLLPYVLDSLVDQRTEELAEIARLGGAQGDSAISLARQAPCMVRQLVSDLGIPDTLARFGVKAEQLPGLIQDGLAVTRLAKAYPGAQVAQAYAQIVNNAFLGQLSGDPA